MERRASVGGSKAARPVPPGLRSAVDLSAALGWLLGAVAVVWIGGAIVAQSVEFVVRHVTIDDSYYYLNTAWNARHLGWVTFDGHNPTNGVQFLWFWLLYAGSFLCETKESFLRLALWACVALGAASVVSAWRIGVLVRGRVGGWLAAALVAHAVVDVAFLRALENTLHLLVCLGAVELYLRFLRDVAAEPARASRRLPWLFFLLALNAWSRLDAGAISAVVALHAVWASRCAGPAAGRGRALLTAGLVCAIAGFVQFYGYWRMGGSVVPVSGLWKTGGVPLADLPASLLEWWGRPLAQVLPLERWLPAVWIHASAVLLAGAVLVGAIRIVRRGEHAPFKVGAGVLIAALAFHSVCMANLVDAVALRRGYWYQAPYVALSALLVTMAIVPSGPGPQLRWLARGRAIAAIGVAFWLLWSARIAQLDFVQRRLDRDNFHGVRYELARWIDANLAPGARLASFNSGELGYFSGRSMTNLDGLINSYSYLRYRQAGGSVAEYLVAEGIDYFVDYATHDGIAEVTELVHSVSLPKVGPIEVRRVLRNRERGK
jgi:hypothetical protein